MVKPILLLSTFNDVNIFHFFCLEIKAVWDTITKNPNQPYALYLQHYNHADPSHVWRKSILEALLPVYTTIDEMKIEMDVTKLNIQTWMFDHNNYIDYPVSSHYTALVKQVKKKYGVENVLTGTYALLVTRKKSRILLDQATQTPFETYFEKRCQESNIPYKIVCFDNISFEDQIKAVSGAKVLVTVHGAAQTSVAFLPDDGHLVDINFRRHWYCDPVCDDHLHKRIPYMKKCNGRLLYHSYFHKADYHNMCYLFGKGYTELDFEYADEFLDNNPINVKHIYVDSEKVMAAIVSKFSV